MTLPGYKTNNVNLNNIQAKVDSGWRLPSYKDSPCHRNNGPVPTIVISHTLFSKVPKSRRLARCFSGFCFVSVFSFFLFVVYGKKTKCRVKMLCDTLAVNVIRSEYGLCRVLWIVSFPCLFPHHLSRNDMKNFFFRLQINRRQCLGSAVLMLVI